MRVNPNWSKPPLRAWVVVAFLFLSIDKGECQQRLAQPQSQPPPSPPQQPTPNVGIPNPAQFLPPLTQGRLPPQRPQFQPPPVPTQFQQQPAPGQFQPQPPPSQFQPQPAQGQFQPQPAFGQFPPQQFSGQTPPLRGQGPFQPPRTPPSPFQNGTSSLNQNAQRIPIKLSSVVNQQQANAPSLTPFHIWDTMSKFLPTLRSHSPDYILSLQPQLIKGIPTVNITQALLEPLNPQVLKALVSQSTGMLISQKSVIVGKLLSRLGDSNIIHMILGAENPSELIEFINPRLLRKNIGVFIRAITEFTSTRFEPNLLKVRLLPSQFLSIMLNTISGGGEHNVSLQTLLSGRTFGNRDLISLSLMGIGCEELIGLAHVEILPFLKIYRGQLDGMRKFVKNFNFPVNLRNCGLDAVLRHLGTKGGDNATNVLSLLDPTEIDAVGGEFFTAVPKEGLENIPIEIRRDILIEIGQVGIFDLLRLASVSQVHWYGKTLLQDLTVPPSPVAPPPSVAAPPSALQSDLSVQSLLKLGNLFCYSDIHNATKETIRQFLATKSRPGMKVCCWDPETQSAWSGILKKVFGADPTAWNADSMIVMGDLMVAFSEAEIGKISELELAKAITPLLEGSGLNFPINPAGDKEPMPFARACVSMLTNPSSYLSSFKALMRKYVLAAELMVNSIQSAQKVDNTGRRVKRETVPKRQWRYTSPPKRQPIPPRRYSRQLQTPRRYRRQAQMMMMPAPPLTSSRMMQMPPQQMAPQQMAPQQMAPQQMAPQQMAPQQMAPQQIAPQQMAPQQMFPHPMANPHMQLLPPQRMQQQMMAPPPQSFMPPATSQQPPMFPPSQVDPRQIPRPAGAFTQSPQFFQNPSIPNNPVGAEGSKENLTKTDERPRSVSDQSAQITCLGIKAAGPAAIGLQLKDFEALEASELMECIEAIGFVDWGEEMKRNLLLLIKEKLNLSVEKLTTINLVELGTLVTALSTSGQASNSNGLFGSNQTVPGHDKFKPFDISSIDLSIPNNLDTVSILGTRIRNPEMLKVIAEKFSEDNGLFNPQSGRSRSSFVRATVWSLGNILCGLEEVVLKTIFDTVPSLFLEVSPMLGRLHGCEPDMLSALAHYAVQMSNYGPPDIWTREDVDTIGVVVAGLTPEALSSIQPIAIRGMHPMAVQALSNSQIQKLSAAQLGNLTYEAAAEVKSWSSLSSDQISALNGVIAVPRNDFNIPPLPITDDLHSRSLDFGGYSNGTAAGNGTLNSADLSDKNGTSKSTLPISDDEDVITIIAEPNENTTDFVRSISNETSSTGNETSPTGSPHLVPEGKSEKETGPPPTSSTHKLGTNSLVNILVPVLIVPFSLYL